jgi:hypothetical protein
MVQVRADGSQGFLRPFWHGLCTIWALSGWQGLLQELLIYTGAVLLSGVSLCNALCCCCHLCAFELKALCRQIAGTVPGQAIAKFTRCTVQHISLSIAAVAACVPVQRSGVTWRACIQTRLAWLHLCWELWCWHHSQRYGFVISMPHYQ